MLLAGDPQVDVGVDEGGQRQEALAVDPLDSFGSIGRPRVSELRDLAGANDDVARFVDPRARVEDANAADHQIGFIAPAGDQVVRVVRGHVYAGCPIRGGASSGSGPAARGRSLPVRSS